MHRIAAALLALPLLVWADKNDDLLAASRKGDVAAVQALLADGADLEAKTPYGQTPLYLAAMQGHAKVVEVLLAKGASTDVRDTFYKADVFAFAMQRKHIDVVKALLLKKPDLGEKALPMIVMMGNKEAMETLLGVAKLSQATLDKGLETAQSMNQPEMAALLSKAGAKAPEPGVTVDAKVLESYAGTYKTTQIPVEVKFFLRDGKFLGQVSGQPEFVPKAKSATVFVLSAVGAEFEFHGSGGMTLRQSGQTFQFQKGSTQ